MAVEELQTDIVLPVGVTNINVKTPYEVKRLDDKVAYKYLDTIGRYAPLLVARCTLTF